MNENGQKGVLDVRPAIGKLRDESLKDLLANGDLANRVIEGGWELLFRDRLLRQLQAEKGGLSFERETIVVPGRRKSEKEKKIEAKRADIAVFCTGPSSRVFDRRNPDGIVEIKHNFATQHQIFTGLEGDVNKWKGWKRGESEQCEPKQGGESKQGEPKRVCELHFVQIVTDIHRLRDASGGECSDGGSRSDFSDSLCKDIFKYTVQPDKTKRLKRIEKIVDCFDKLQADLDDSRRVWREVIRVNGEEYFGQKIEFEADLHVFVLSQGATRY